MNARNRGRLDNALGRIEHYRTVAHEALIPESATGELDYSDLTLEEAKALDNIKLAVNELRRRLEKS